MKKSPPWLIALVLVAGLGIIAGGWWLAERRTRENDAVAKVQAVLAGFQQGLPREYAPGLMLERVAFEGPALVMTIRALSRSVPEAGDSSEVSRAEKAPLCPPLASCSGRILSFPFQFNLVQPVYFNT